MKKTDAWYNKIEKGVLIFLLSIMTILMFTTVITRIFFKFTFSWAEQITKVLFVWATFAGISYAAYLGVHMRVSAITLLLRDEKKKDRILLLGDAVAALFGLVICYYMLSVTWNAFQLQQTFTSVPWLNVGFMYIGGVLGMLGFSVRCIQSIISKIAEQKSKSNTALSETK